MSGLPREPGAAGAPTPGHGRLRIKLCGVRRVEDALLCAAAGADEIGVVLATQSRRCISLALAQQIRAALPPETALVGVLLDATVPLLVEAIDAGPFSALQLHGALPPASVVEESPLPLYRALQIEGAASLPAPIGQGQEELAGFARVLLDGPRGGGAGSRFDWQLAWAARSCFAQQTIFIAGGLNAGNVAAAIASGSPDGVDVSSGIEGANGFKDPGRVRAFIDAARAAMRGEPTRVE